MKWTSALAIYVLFWSFSVFLVLPFGVRNHHEAGEPLVPGQSDGAPVNFAPKRIVLWTTVVSAVLFGLFYLNYVEGWILPNMLDMFSGEAERAAGQ